MSYSTLKKELVNLSIACYAICLYRFVQTNLYDVVSTVGPSMLPTCNSIGDVYITDKFVYRFKPMRKNQIVIVKNPLKFQDFLCKRVIAIGGESVKVNGNYFYVPKGMIWVEGDNKNQSLDSRDFGPVPEGLIVGILGKKIWPFWI